MGARLLGVRPMNESRVEIQRLRATTSLQDFLYMPIM